jgi:cytidylate kinase
MAKDVETLIEQQARLWELRRQVARQGGEAARRALVHLDEGPWLTISRQLGAGGTGLARRLAEGLGWQVYDQEILLAIARQTHTKEKVISRLDEHAVGHFNDLVRHLLVPDDLGQAGFLLEMTRVVWALGHQGKAILVGRGANWVLDARFGLRVRIVAPEDARIERIAEREGLSLAGAKKRVAAHDNEQRAFIRQAYGRRIDDPMGYDLVINLGQIAPDCAAETVLVALRRKLESQS